MYATIIAYKGGVALAAPIKLLPSVTGSEGKSEAILKHLRASDDAPAGKRFGWGGEWETPHLVNFVLAAVGPQPSDGPGVIAAVKRSVHRTTPNAGPADQGPRLGPGTLHDALVRLVDRFVALLEQRVVSAGVDLWSAEADVLCMASGYDPGRAAPDHLTFHFSPFRAEVVWLARGGHAERVEIYAPRSSDEVARDICGRWQRSAILRTATVPVQLLLTAAKARLETSPRRGSKRPRPTRSTKGKHHDD